MIETLQFGSFVWSHIINPTEENYEFLVDNYHFHHLDIEDCKSKVQRPKIDIYEDYYFIILHLPSFDEGVRSLTTQEVKIFWGKGFIITIKDSHWIVKKFFDYVKEHFEDFRASLMNDSSDSLLYRILEKLLKETLALLSMIGNEVECISTELFSKKSQTIIEDISITRKNIIMIDTMFKPQLRLFNKFETGEIKGYAAGMEGYWGNILDYYQKMWDLTEDYQELIEGLSKTYDSLQTNRINEIIKVLTLISTILLPVTFIASLYGMNVGLPFQAHPLAFWIVMGSMLLVSIGFLLYFRRKRWM
jgi:magnesium transporter